MKKYEVTYKHVVEMDITCVVEAANEEEALQKAQDGDVLLTDEDDAPMQGLEIKDEEARELSDEEVEEMGL